MTRFSNFKAKVLHSRLLVCRLDSISEYGRDIGAQASKLKTVIVNMTDELGDEEPIILNKQTEFEKLSRIGT